jgi:hypothetical protein
VWPRMHLVMRTCSGSSTATEVAALSLNRCIVTTRPSRSRVTFLKRLEIATSTMAVPCWDSQSADGGCAVAFALFQ